MSIYSKNKESVVRINECVDKVKARCERIKQIKEEFAVMKASLKINGGDGLK